MQNPLNLPSFFQIPLQILLAASHLLNSLTTSVRPQFFLALEIVQKFYGTMNAGGLEALPLNVSFHRENLNNK